MFLIGLRFLKCVLKFTLNGARCFINRFRKINVLAGIATIRYAFEIFESARKELQDGTNIVEFERTSK